MAVLKLRAASVSADEVSESEDHLSDQRHGEAEGWAHIFQLVFSTEGPCVYMQHVNIQLYCISF